MLESASATLRERLLGKIVMAGPATPCATWVGAYNAPSRKSERAGRKPARRPVIRAGRKGSGMLYVAPTMLRLAGVEPERDDQVQAAHRCPTGTPIDGMYRCVDLACLRWASPRENELDKLES